MHYRRFHAAQRRADHGGRKNRDWVILPCFLERRPRRFRFSSARTGTTPDRRASIGAVFQRPPGAPQIENRASQNLRQRLDWNERRDFERRYYRRKLSRRGRLGGDEKRRSKHSRGGEPGRRGEKVSVILMNAQRSTFNAQRSTFCVGRWTLDVGRWAFSLQ